MFKEFVLFAEGLPPLRCVTEWSMEETATRLYRRGHEVFVAGKLVTGGWKKWLFRA